MDKLPFIERREKYKEVKFYSVTATIVINYLISKGHLFYVEKEPHFRDKGRLIDTFYFEMTPELYQDTLYLKQCKKDNTKIEFNGLKTFKEADEIRREYI